jgi:hypothetical protein
MGTAPSYGNPKLFTDVGDGVQTAFTLDWNPGSKNAVQVYVNGIFTTLFSVSNNILTFDDAPANLASIIVTSIVAHNSIVVPADTSVTAAKLANDVNTRFNDIETDISNLNTIAGSRVKQYFYAGF